MLLYFQGMGLLSREWTKKYGDIVGYYNGVMPGIILRDVELIKRTFIQDFQYFTGRQVMASVSKNIAVNEVRISRVHGDDWRHLKKIVLPAFKTANIKKAVPLMQGCVEECFRAMDRKLAGSDGCVEVFEPYCIMATDFGLQFFAGARMDIQRDDAASLALYKAARGSVGQFGGTALFFLNLLPDSRLLHRIIIAMQSIFSQLPSDEMVDRMLPIINHRRANPDPTKEDVLQLLLNSEKEERMSNGKIEGRQLSSILLSHPVELRTASNTCIFIVAGIDNIAAPLAFASYLLSEHQDVQDKVRAEVQALLEKEGQLTYDGLGELTYLGQVLSESLRLYPSLPGSVRRVCDEDYECNGVRILKGMSVSVPTLDVHYDPRLWPEPTKFDPERRHLVTAASVDGEPVAGAISPASLAAASIACAVFTTSSSEGSRSSRSHVCMAGFLSHTRNSPKAQALVAMNCLRVSPSRRLRLLPPSALMERLHFNTGAAAKEGPSGHSVS
ncbi:hypothetical protein HPB49_004635 [Dermacentor silvarum]|uniref:Uncharacterized protein n=1 Tax=Dermacentor silvarum TaxID=543639 RepID=A0ACB8CPS5_DERSI|nr:hypothetical protein HPB49_004635 [Dermacentor silvarum]